MHVFFSLLFTLGNDLYSSKYYLWEFGIGFFKLNLLFKQIFFFFKKDTSLANINKFQFNIKSLCLRGVIIHVTQLLLANDFQFLSYMVLQPRNIMTYSYPHQKGERILKAEVQTEKEIGNYLRYVSYDHDGAILH